MTRFVQANTTPQALTGIPADTEISLEAHGPSELYIHVGPSAAPGHPAFILRPKEWLAASAPAGHSIWVWTAVHFSGVAYEETP